MSWWLWLLAIIGTGIAVSAVLWALVVWSFMRDRNSRLVGD